MHGPELEPTWQIAKEGGLGPKALTEQERDGWFITQASGGVPTEHKEVVNMYQLCCCIMPTHHLLWKYEM